MPRKHTFAIVVLVGIWSGCATQPVEPKPESVSSRGLKDSGIDITYVLGHSHRRFIAQAKNSFFLAQSFVDKQILKENSVNEGHYTAFFSKVEQFVSAPTRGPSATSNSNNCRSPFTITLRVGADTKAVSGCRGMDDGALSHLLRDGEFLLSSRK